MGNIHKFNIWHSFIYLFIYLFGTDTFTYILTYKGQYNTIIQAEITISSQDKTQYKKWSVIKI